MLRFRFVRGLAAMALLSVPFFFLASHAEEGAVLPTEAPSISPVQRVMEAHLMSGYPDGQFHPEAEVSRAELASILVKAFELDKRSPAPQAPLVIHDVPATHWASQAIQQVVQDNVMKGYRDGRFYPNQKITRAEGFAILAQAYGVFQFEAPVVSETLAPYQDADKIPAWAQKAMATVLHEGFVNVEQVGEAQRLRPLAPLTRGDIAYALSKYLDRQKEAKSVAPGEHD